MVRLSRAAGLWYALALLMWAAFPVLSPSDALGLDFQTGDVSASLNGSGEVTVPARLHVDTPQENPSFLGIVKTDVAAGEHLSFHCVLQGGYDGAALHPRDDEIMLGFDKVYPSVDRYAEVPEAYATFSVPSLDVRVGIQKFSWGTLDQFNPTDNLSPLDLRHLLDTDPLRRKIGVPAVRVTNLTPLIALNIEAVWIPFMVPYRLPDPGDRWYPPIFHAPPVVNLNFPGTTIPLPPIFVQQINDEPNLPARNFRDSEFGVRVSRTIGSTDLGLSYFNGYDRRPVISDSGTVAASLSARPLALNLAYDLHVIPVFHRIQVYGADIARSWQAFTFRAEAAYTSGRYVNVGLDAIGNIISQFRLPPLSEISFKTAPDRLIATFPFSPTINYQKDGLSAGAGVDYQWGNYLVTLTALTDYIVDYRGEPLVYKEVELTWVLGVHARFLQDTLQVETGIVYNPMEDLILSRTEGTYAVTDAFTVGANLLLLTGRADSPLGQYRDNDQVSAFARYSF